MEPQALSDRIHATRRTLREHRCTAPGSPGADLWDDELLSAWEELDRLERDTRHALQSRDEELARLRRAALSPTTARLRLRVLRDALEELADATARAGAEDLHPAALAKLERARATVAAVAADLAGELEELER